MKIVVDVNCSLNKSNPQRNRNDNKDCRKAKIAFNRNSTENVEDSTKKVNNPKENHTIVHHTSYQTWICGCSYPFPSSP